MNPISESEIVLERGAQPLPFFAEYPYYVWGEINYDSEGDCRRPTDREWSWLEILNRKTRERLSIRSAEKLTISGPSAVLAATLTALRTGATSPATAPADHGNRVARAARVRAQFLDEMLAPFDSHGWWGGWKWVGAFSTDLTSGLRVVMQCVHERRIVDPGVLGFLRSWSAEPPQQFHHDGVKFALEYLSGL